MIIDANVLFGFEGTQALDLSIDTVLDLMDRKAIDRAMIVNCQCRYSDFVAGNRATADIMRSYPDRFYGMLGFNLSCYIGIEREVERCIFTLGFSGIRFFNTDTNFITGWGSSFDSLGMNSVLKMIDGAGIPVFIEGGYPFKQIRELCDKYPAIPFIASGVGYLNMSEVILAVGSAKNLYVEISTLDSFDGITVLVSHIGADKVIFGSGMPYNCPSCELLMVRNALISEEDKTRILHGNILGILNGRRI